MTNSLTRKPIEGSQRGAPLHGARVVGSVPADERFEVTVRVRRRASLDALSTNGFHADKLPAQRKYLDRGYYAENYGADLPI